MARRGRPSGRPAVTNDIARATAPLIGQTRGIAWAHLSVRHGPPAGGPYTVASAVSVHRAATGSQTGSVTSSVSRLYATCTCMPKRIASGVQWIM